MKKTMLLLVMSVTACAMALPTPATYISFNDTTFGGATYIDDQPSVDSAGDPYPVAGAINLVTEDGCGFGQYGSFENNGWWIQSGDSLEVANTTNGSGTVAMWARLDLSAVRQKYPLLWDSAPDDCAQGWKSYAEFSNNNVQESWYSRTRVNNDSWVVATATIGAKDAWFHYAFTWDQNVDGTYDIAVYIDGQLVQSAEGKTITAMDDVIRIGGGGTGLGHCKWQGDMDEVYVFNEALSAADVATLVPEPATMAILGLGGLFLRRRRS